MSHKNEIEMGVHQATALHVTVTVLPPNVYFSSIKLCYIKTEE